MIDDKARGKEARHYYSVGATCLFLASKVEENCRKMKDLVVACVRVAQKQPNKEVDEQDKEFWRWRDTILLYEDEVLEALCFDLMLESPYRALYNLLITFGVEDNKPLRNAAWSFVNDSCNTALCLLYPAHAIAAAAIYCAARHCDVKLLDDEYGRPWWEVAGVGLVDIRKACNFIADIYENAPGKADQNNWMYTHTPEEGDEREAKTRQVRPEEEIIRMPTPRNNGDRSSGRGSRDSFGAESEVSRKRGRSDLEEGEEDGEVVEKWGGGSDDDGSGGSGRQEKRLKRDEDTKSPRTNGLNGSDPDLRNGSAIQNGSNKKMGNIQSGLVSPNLDDGSEEGELEQ